MLFVSHNLAAIRTLCHRAMLLHDGRIVSIGAVDATIDRYVQDFAGAAESMVNLPAPRDEDPAAAGLSLHFLTIDDRPKAEFRINEPWKIRMEFEVFRPLEEVVGSMGLMTLEGVPVTTYYSRSRSLLPGRFSIDFELDLPLAPCDLQFNVGILTERRIVYYHEGQGHVSVIDAAAGDQPYSTPPGILTSKTRPVIHDLGPDEPTAHFGPAGRNQPPGTIADED